MEIRSERGNDVIRGCRTTGGLRDDVGGAVGVDIERAVLFDDPAIIVDLGRLVGAVHNPYGKTGRRREDQAGGFLCPGGSLRVLRDESETVSSRPRNRGIESAIGIDGNRQSSRCRGCAGDRKWIAGSIVAE